MTSIRVSLFHANYRFSLSPTLVSSSNRWRLTGDKLLHIYSIFCKICLALRRVKGQVGLVDWIVDWIEGSKFELCSIYTNAASLHR